MDYNLWQARKAINLFRLLENETMEMFSTEERSKSKRKIGGTKACEADKVREFITNSRVENEAFHFWSVKNLVWIPEMLHASLVNIYC